jgi:hypothetical protein
MATFNQNMQVVADKLVIVAEKLTAINTSLETIAGAIADGKITVDPALVEAVQALAFNGIDFDLGDLIIRLTGKTPIIEGI